MTSATLKIADFGQSKVLSKDGSALTDAGVTGGVGTVCYMAPELVHRAGVITIMSDVKLELDAYKIDVYAPPLPPCLTVMSRLYPSTMFGHLPRFPFPSLLPATSPFLSPLIT